MSVAEKFIPCSLAPALMAGYAGTYSLRIALRDDLRFLAYKHLCTKGLNVNIGEA